MLFVKIKIDEKEVYLKKQTVGGGAKSDQNVWELKGFDEPLPAFNDCMQSFKDYVVDICDLPRDQKSCLTIRQVSFTYDDDGSYGIVVTALKALFNSNAPLVINTPFMPAKSGNGNPCLDEEVRSIIDDLQEHAEDYINGERKFTQTHLKLAS